MKQVTLEIGGKERTFHFGLGFIGNMLEGTDTNMADFDRLRMANPFKWTPIMMFYSLQYNCLRSGQEVDFTLNNVIDWLDESPQDVFEKFNIAFVKSLTKDVPENKEVKKKVTKK